MKNNPAAVVVGADLRGVGVVRSLASLNMPIFVIGTSPFDSAMLSRYAQPVVAPRLEGGALVSTLVKVARQAGDGAVLFVIDEAAVRTISRHRAILHQFYRFTMPSAATVDMLMDKSRFHAFALGNGLPVPVSVNITGTEGLGALERLNYPVVIKPRDKMLVQAGRTARLGLAAHCNDAKAICRQMLLTGNALIVQEWIEGPQDHICFCLFFRAADGRLLRSFVGRKLVCAPPQVGHTVVAAPAPEWQEDVMACTERVLAETDFVGLGSLDFKWDAQRGKLFIIGATVSHADWQEEVATACGVNIPAAAYCTEAGLRLPPAEPRAAIWRSSFLHRIPSRFRNDTVPLMDGYWRREDPLPGFMYYAGAPARLASDLATQIKTRFLTAKQPSKYLWAGKLLGSNPSQ